MFAIVRHDACISAQGKSCKRLRLNQKFEERTIIDAVSDKHELEIFLRLGWKAGKRIGLRESRIFPCRISNITKHDFSSTEAQIDRSDRFGGEISVPVFFAVAPLRDGTP